MQLNIGISREEVATKCSVKKLPLKICLNFFYIGKPVNNTA